MVLAHGREIGAKRQDVKLQLNKKKTINDRLQANPEFRRLFAIEYLAVQATELIASLMREQNLSKADLARKLGKSRSWITQLLGGQKNMTISTLAEIANAMNTEVRLQAQPVKPLTRNRSGLTNHGSPRKVRI